MISLLMRRLYVVYIVRADARDTWCSTNTSMNVAHGPPAQEVGLGRV